MTTHNIAFTASHFSATEAGISILKQGGTATEAMVAAAAAISVVYPHMNSIGGDSFWLIDNPNQKTPIAIDACGRAASNTSAYNTLTQIPERGGLSALTQAGTIRGWQKALELDEHAALPLSKILAPAIALAREGFTVTKSLQAGCEKLAAANNTNDAFKSLYIPNGKPLQAGQHFKNPKLAATFEHLAKQGLNAFYEGALANSFAADLAKAGSSITVSDIANTKAEVVTALNANLSGIDCYNLPAPTQGVHSLQIIGAVNKLKHKAKTDADWMHLIVEATKQSFTHRPTLWADPEVLGDGYKNALTDNRLSQLANNIDMTKAKKWPFSAEPGDTVWMAARDKNGQLVSFIQSIYWEFGSGILMSEGGFVWNNRGLSFSLNNEGIDADNNINALAPNKKPAHTLNPAMAKFSDGRRLAYGTMGGEGQPQTQAAVFAGYAWRNKSINQAISDPRWLLGRTWGDTSTNLKIEKGLVFHIEHELNQRDHDWVSVDNNNEMMGHAGAILDTPTSLEAATDPRSDGRATVTTAGTQCQK
ncbi:gamma-glutamyltransferase [Pseudoalteromonas sp. NSLLW24]|uniref:gamma-glutamyltransferase family protein n=1 Tax=unclassified Pseudoalteromonas TaxID=194690 RepID=UPI00097662E5|nr:MULTISPECIES: gamma-glutamyltransferase [unclassified Pseudoalteromonas]MBH0000511.1 gamma-glutamyltransferase [Pseudoalteromonas sp. NSLLW24]